MGWVYWCMDLSRDAGWLVGGLVWLGLICFGWLHENWFAHPVFPLSVPLSFLHYDGGSMAARNGSEGDGIGIFGAIGRVISTSGHCLFSGNSRPVRAWRWK